MDPEYAFFTVKNNKEKTELKALYQHLNPQEDDEFEFAVEAGSVMVLELNHEKSTSDSSAEFYITGNFDAGEESDFYYSFPSGIKQRIEDWDYQYRTVEHQTYEESGS